MKKTKTIEAPDLLPHYLRPSDVERIFRIPAKTLANLRSQGRGPCYTKVGKNVFYRFRDVEEWFQEHGIEVKTEEAVPRRPKNFGETLDDETKSHQK